MENELKEILSQEINELRILQRELKLALSNTPDGQLNISQKAGKNPQYYVHYGKGVRKYISLKEKDAAALLAQKDYNSALLKLVEKRLRNLLRLGKTYREPFDNVYKQYPDSWKQLIVPARPTTEQFIEEWYAQNPGGKNGYPVKSSLFTDRGEQVRSKSEKIIADLFHKHQIPYVYEPQIV